MKKEKEKPLTPKAVTRFHTNPPDEHLGIEYDLENCPAKWFEQSEMKISKQKKRHAHLITSLPYKNSTLHDLHMYSHSIYTYKIIFINSPGKVSSKAGNLLH